MQSNEKIIKLAIVGDGGVGKTSLIRAKKDHTFKADSKLTVGVGIECLPFQYHKLEGKDTHFLAVDLGGQERFHFIHDVYIKGLNIAIIVYDLSRYTTFLNIPKWFDLITNENPDCPILIVGSKLDLVNEERLLFYKAEFELMKKDILDESRIYGHFVISSKDNMGIEEIFSNSEKAVQYCLKEVLVTC